MRCRLPWATHFSNVHRSCSGFSEPSASQRATIDLQQHRSGEPGQGITDIEIRLSDHFHVIIEAKVEMAVPTIEQCRKYLPRFHGEPSQKLVTLIQSPDRVLLNGYAKQDRALSKLLVGFHWADWLCTFFAACINMQGVVH